jgi:hypothetical protein
MESTNIEWSSFLFYQKGFLCMDKSEYVSRMKEREKEIRENMASNKEKTDYGYEALIEINRELKENYSIEISPPERAEFSNLREIQNYIRELSTSGKLEHIDPREFHIRRRFRELLSKLEESSDEVDTDTLIEFNTKNHIEYFEYVGEKLSLSESDLGLYIFAEEDVIPAVHLGPKKWYYIGLSDQGEKEFNGAEINFISQDINEGLPQVQDSSIDLMLIKGPGPADKSTLENSFRIARKKVKEDGIILSDVEIDMKGLQPVRNIDPKPEVVKVQGKPLKDPYTGYTPFGLSEPLIVYKKRI